MTLYRCYGWKTISPGQSHCLHMQNVLCLRSSSLLFIRSNEIIRNELTLFESWKSLITCWHIPNKLNYRLAHRRTHTQTHSRTQSETPTQISTRTIVVPSGFSLWRRCKLYSNMELCTYSIVCKTVAYSQQRQQQQRATTTAQKWRTLKFII